MSGGIEATGIEVLCEELEEMLKESEGDWSFKADCAFTCAWGAEVRVSDRGPLFDGGCQYVSTANGEATIIDAATKALGLAIGWLMERRSQNTVTPRVH